MTDSEKIDLLLKNLNSMASDVSGLKSDVSELKSDVSELKSHVSKLESDVTNIKITLENNIDPRLQNIESCYTSTYDRYRDSVEEHETMKTDIDILKKVVKEHSEKLQQLA